MSNIVIRKNRNTTTQLSTLVISTGDLFIDVTKPTLVVGDGVTAGGIPLAHEAHTHADATEGTDGFMSAADKTKLDNLSQNAGILNIQSNTSTLPSENTLNFSTDFTLADNPGSATNIAISATFINEMKDDMVAYILAIS